MKTPTKAKTPRYAPKRRSSPEMSALAGKWAQTIYVQLSIHEWIKSYAHRG